MSSLANAFLETVTRHPERPFVEVWMADEPHTTTYAGAACRVAWTVEALRAQGAEPGEPILCVLEDVASTIHFVLGCLFARAVPIPISPASSSSTIEKLGQKVGARLALTTPEDLPTVVAVAGLRPLLYATRRGQVDRRAFSIAEGKPNLDHAARLLCDAAVTIRLSDRAMFLPTSGSTGEPKLVIRTVLAQERIADAFASVFTSLPDSSARFLVIAALTHALGHGFFMAGLLGGATFCVPGAIDTRTPLADVRRIRPTHVLTTPRVVKALHQQWVESGSSEPLFDSALKVLRVAGARPDDQLLALLADQGVDVGECYGATEAGPIAITPLRGWRRGYVGKLLADVEVKREDDGELLVKSPSVTLGYYDDEEQTQAALTSDGFLRTGDFVEVDEGYVKFCGRKKDTFNTFEGSNIYPARVEDLLEQLPWVREAVLIGDQQPYLTALVVVADPPAGPFPDGLGFIDPSATPALYDRARRDLARMNGGLEPIEQICRFHLFAHPMRGDLYRVVGLNKRKRSRAEINVVYATYVDQLYAGDQGAANLVGPPPSAAC